MVGFGLQGDLHSTSTDKLEARFLDNEVSGHNIGAEIITNTISGIPYYNYGICIVTPKSPVLMIKALCSLHPVRSIYFSYPNPDLGSPHIIYRFRI